MTDLKEYELTTSTGVTYTAQLSDDEAKKLGVKAKSAPANKAAKKPANKAAAAKADK